MDRLINIIVYYRDSFARRFTHPRERKCSVRVKYFEIISANDDDVDVDDDDAAAFS